MILPFVLDEDDAFCSEVHDKQVIDKYIYLEYCWHDWCPGLSWSPRCLSFERFGRRQFAPWRIFCCFPPWSSDFSGDELVRSNVEILNYTFYMCSWWLCWPFSLRFHNRNCLAGFHRFCVAFVERSVGMMIKVVRYAVGSCLGCLWSLLGFILEDFSIQKYR